MKTKGWILTVICSMFVANINEKHISIYEKE